MGRYLFGGKSSDTPHAHILGRNYYLHLRGWGPYLKRYNAIRGCAGAFHSQHAWGFECPHFSLNCRLICVSVSEESADKRLTDRNPI